MATPRNLLASGAIAALVAGFVQACATPENNFDGLNDASLYGFPSNSPSSAGGAGSQQSGYGGTSSGSGGAAAPCRVAFCPSSGSGSPCCMPDNVTCGVDYGMGCVTPIIDSGTSTGGYTGAGGYYTGAGGTTSTGGVTDAGSSHASGGGSGAGTGGTAGGPPPPVTDASVVSDPP